MIVNRRNAIAAIERLGSCLVFPLANRPQPFSLWSHFYPRTPMRWEWDAGGDNRVPELWHLRSVLSESGQVVYTKWLRGRATFFSLPLFSALVRLLSRDEDLGLPEEARTLYQCLEERSPLSTKELKLAAGLRGRASEAAFTRGMKELWSRMLIVAWGERDDGAFPSLQTGASKLLHHAAWQAGREMSEADALRTLDRFWTKDNPFRRYFDELRAPRSRRSR